jgi:branched-chain amino acid transport system permease protein
MLSLAFAQIVFTVIFKWKTLTGGDDGLLDVWPPSLLKSPAAYYYFTLVIVGLSILALHAIVASPFGYALKAVRENPRRARYIGIDVRRHQLAAFVISGAFSGVAGGSSPSTTAASSPTSPTSPSPSSRWWSALLGGVQSFFGPLAGPSASRSSSG